MAQPNEISFSSIRTAYNNVNSPLDLPQNYGLSSLRGVKYEIEGSISVPEGQAEYTSPGTYTWVCPENITSVSVVCIGGGGGGMYYNSSTSWYQFAMNGGGGGGLGWKNNISVIPGNSYTVVVGARGLSGAYSSGSTAGGQTYFINAATVSGNGGAPGRYASSVAGGTYTGDGGGNGGGNVYVSSWSGPTGGGGAGGYLGSGGPGVHSGTANIPAAGSGAGAGGAQVISNKLSAGGGGVGLKGNTGTATSNSGGGSGGTNGGTSSASQGTIGGLYGGGGGGASTRAYNQASNGGSGGCRIIWPGHLRQYPSTNVADSNGTFEVGGAEAEYIPNINVSMSLLSGNDILSMEPSMTITSADVSNGGSTMESSIVLTFTSTEPTSDFGASSVTVEVNGVTDNSLLSNTFNGSNQHSSGGYYEYTATLTLSTNVLPTSHVITVAAGAYTNSRTSIGCQNRSPSTFSFAWGITGVPFPVSNPTLQWVIGGNETYESGISIISSSTVSVDPESYWGGLTVGGTITWSANIGCSLAGYTNNEGDTVRYLTIPPGGNLTTMELSNNPTLIGQNGGYTWWWVMITPTGTQSYWRPMSYRGVAFSDTYQHTGNSRVMGGNSTQEYSGPLFFYKGPTSPYFAYVTGGFKYYTLNSYPVRYSTNTTKYIHIMAFTVTTGGLIKYTSKVRAIGSWAKPSSGEGSVDLENIALTTVAGFALKTSGSATGKPFFNDHKYWNNNTTDSLEILNLIHSGFANRVYSDSEVTTLVRGFMDIYMGSNVT